MAIVISNPVQFKQQQNRYVDVALDFTTQLNQDLIQQNDIKTIVDDRAIANRLSNVLMTLPGQMVLYPEFGCNLNQYLFNPVSKARGYVMGRYIQTQINKYVPEVVLTQVLVVANEDTQDYDIEIAYQIALLDDAGGSTLRGNINRPLNSITFTNE